jgi:HK97 family phage portal protein
VWYVDGRRVSRLDLVHIPWITIPGRTLALSPIEYFASTISAGLDTQQYGADWFKNGGVPPGRFKNNAVTITAEAAETISARLMATIKRRRPIVYGTDWDYEPISIPPEQAQFIETQKLTANQIAAIYGINAVEIGGEPPNGLTYSNETDRHAMQRLANIRPYLTRFERAFASWLPDRQYVKFNDDAIIRADIKTRHDVYKIQHDIGLLSVNEQRALEDLPPIDGGDSHVPAQIQQQPQIRQLSVAHLDDREDPETPLRVINP